MTHADAIREAERKVIDAAKMAAECLREDVDREWARTAKRMETAVDPRCPDNAVSLYAHFWEKSLLFAGETLAELEAQTCEACKGTGAGDDWASTGDYFHCGACSGTGRATKGTE
jgi:hypothetical protein